MRWPNIQCIPTFAQWIDDKRDWNNAREDGQSGAFLGLEYLDYWPVVTVGQAQRENGQSGAFLGLEFLNYFQAVTIGQAAREDGQSGAFLGLEFLNYVPTTPPMIGTPQSEAAAEFSFLGLESLSYDS